MAANYDQMLPILGWVIHYGDGSSYSSAEGDWDSAPAQGVQIVELLHEHPYRDLVEGDDEYLLPGETSVKRGSEIPEADYYRLQASVVGGNA